MESFQPGLVESTNFQSEPVSIENKNFQPEKKILRTANINFELNIINCQNYLLNLVSSKLNASLSLRDSELVYRAIRYLKKEPQILEGLEKEINQKVAYQLLFNAVSIGHTKGLLNIEEDAVCYYCIEHLTQIMKEQV